MDINQASRRTFLRQTALIAAAGLAQPAFGQNAARLKLGFLGAGHSHFKGKLAAAAASPDFEVVGVHEPAVKLRAGAPAGTRWLGFDELIAEASVVVVESAVAQHAEDARRALTAGRHVHVEKPPAASLEDFLELQRLAARGDLVLQVGYMWRYNPGITAALEAARRGWLGEVFLVRATMNTLIDDESRRAWAQFPGGAMFEQGCHLVDAVVRLLGRPSKVTPFLKYQGNSTVSLADNTVAVLEYPRALALITSAPLQPNAGAHRFFEVLGSNGTAKVQPLEQPVLTMDLATAAGPHPKGRAEVKLPEYQRYVDEFAALAAAVRGRQPLPVTPETERDVQETVLRASGML